MSAPPTLLFCVGATKSGTSWLYDFLSGHADCHLRGIKELHYFDFHDLGANWALEDVKRQIVGTREALAADPTQDPQRLNKKLSELRALRKLLRPPPDDAAYLTFVTDGRGDRRLVADVTPSYSMLSAERLSRMAALLPDVRFLYIVRDPVDRLWSHVRMMADRREGKADARAARAADILNGVIAGREPEIARRSDYRGALERLNAAVDPDRLMVAFYEDLLTAPGISRLCGFLGITDRPADLDKRVHQGAAIELTSAQALAARAWLAPHYDYVEQTIKRLPDAWRRALTEV